MDYYRRTKESEFRASTLQTRTYHRPCKGLHPRTGHCERHVRNRPIRCMHQKCMGHRLNSLRNQTPAGILCCYRNRLSCKSHRPRRGLVRQRVCNPGSPSNRWLCMGCCRHRRLLPPQDSKVHTLLSLLHGVFSASYIGTVHSPVALSHCH